jgi:hypothetical protein
MMAEISFRPSSALKPAPLASVDSQQDVDRAARVAKREGRGP